MAKKTSINKIENKVRHFAKKMKVKISNIDIEIEDSLDYEVEDGIYDKTDVTFFVDITLAEPEKMTDKMAKKFIGKLEYKFYGNKHYRHRGEAVFVTLNNYDIAYED